MKKLLLAALAFFASVFALSAQDIIILKNSERIEANVLNINSKGVSYTVTGKPEVMNLRADEVKCVVGKDGQVSVFKRPKVYEKSITPNRQFGVSVGYVQKQLWRDGNYAPWCMAKPVTKTGKASRRLNSPALRVGFHWSPEFKYGLGLYTGIFYEMSYASARIVENKYDYNKFYDITSCDHSLSIPFRFQFRYEFIKDLSAFIYTGPSLDISLSYKRKIHMSDDLGDGNTDRYKDMEDDMHEAEGLKPFNLLWGVGGGFRYKGLQFTIGADWGALDISSQEEPIYLNKPLHLTISYVF